MCMSLLKTDRVKQSMFVLYPERIATLNHSNSEKMD